MGKFVNLLGQKFGRLVVVEKTAIRGSSGAVFWKCLCDCGNTKNVSSSCLKTSQTKSCGCYFIDVARKKGQAKKIHGMTNTRLYRIWSNMKNRCYSETNKKYKNYGGRGIIVCDEWKNSFEQFYKDMGIPDENLTLDRIDVNGNYEPANCKWSTQKEQQNNRRNNLIIEYQSKKYTLQQICDLLGKNSDIVQQRLKRGDSVERSLR